MRTQKGKLQKRIVKASEAFNKKVLVTAQVMRKDPKNAGVPQSRLIPRAVDRTANELREAIEDDHMQWHRWFKANKKRQAQIRAIRRLGHKIKVPDLRREAIV